METTESEEGDWKVACSCYVTGRKKLLLLEFPMPVNGMGLMECLPRGCLTHWSSLDVDAVDVGSGSVPCLWIGPFARECRRVVFPNGVESAS